MHHITFQSPLNRGRHGSCFGCVDLCQDELVIRGPKLRDLLTTPRKTRGGHRTIEIEHASSDGGDGDEQRQEQEGGENAVRMSDGRGDEDGDGLLGDDKEDHDDTDEDIRFLVGVDDYGFGSGSAPGEVAFRDEFVRLPLRSFHGRGGASLVFGQQQQQQSRRSRKQQQGPVPPPPVPSRRWWRSI